MLDRLQAQRTAADAERLESVRQEIGKIRRRVYELEQMTAKLYENKVCGSISAASFAVLLEKTEQERRQREKLWFAGLFSGAGLLLILLI